MAKERLRTVQPAHKSDKVTVSQAKKAWLAVARDRSASKLQDDRTNASNETNPGTGEDS
ncbi:MAG TPA: hypothetical protein VF647_10830 [Longimicrobium sp.]|jgi:hypothetical protein